jgi:hypothetical protein
MESFESCVTERLMCLPREFGDGVERVGDNIEPMTMDGVKNYDDIRNFN